MSPTEYLDLIATYGTAAATHVMNCVSLIFAYLVAAYLAGEKLTPFQVRSVSLIYSIFILFPAISGLDAVSKSFALTREFQLEHPSLSEAYYPGGRWDGTFSQIWLVALAFVIFASWVLSLIFMARIRSHHSGWPGRD